MMPKGERLLRAAEYLDGPHLVGCCQAIDSAFGERMWWEPLHPDQYFLHDFFRQNFKPEDRNSRWHYWWGPTDKALPCHKQQRILALLFCREMILSEAEHKKKLTKKRK